MPTTYTIPPGLTSRQKKAMAALLACAPCCGSGSGSGSGSGGSELPNCCSEVGTLTAITFSYELPGCAACLCDTGTGGEIDSGACDGFGGEYQTEPDILSQAGIGTLFQDCSTPGVVDIQFQISLCCYTRNDSTTFYQVNAIFTWNDGVNSVGYKWRTKVFDAASCNPFSAEVTGLAPFETNIIGSPCTCPALLSFIMTGSY